MNAQITDSQFSYRLPSMSYIDAKWEEPSLRAGVATPRVVRTGGLGAWLSRQAAAFVTWRRNREAAAELSAMSDRELLDIGLSRADIGRVFAAACNEDLRRRDARS